MDTFTTYYNKMMLEMARPSRIFSGSPLEEHIKQILDRVGYMLRYGKTPAGQQVVDSKGEPAYGMDDNVIQHRKLLYLFLKLNYDEVLHGRILNPTSPTYTSNLHEVINDALLYSRKIIDDHDPDTFRSIGTSVQRLSLSILLSVKQNPDKLNNPKLADPTEVGDFMNATRNTSNAYSVNKVLKREKEHDNPAKEIDRVKAEAKPLNKQANWKMGRQKAAETRQRKAPPQDDEV